MSSGFRTIAAPAAAEVVEKKSRFIGQLAPAVDEAQALEHLEAVRSEHRLARHNVYAYVLRNGRVRYSDDGEPSGTSGLPTLEALQHAQLVDVCLVTTRYFGGVLLGTGGLVRAYTAAAQAAIGAASIVTISRCVDVRLSVPYAAYEATVRLANDQGAQVESADFGVEVQLVLRLIAGTEQPLLDKLAEVTRGQGAPQVSEPFDAAFQGKGSMASGQSS